MDTSKFLGKFADATREHLQRMNSLLLELEQDPDRPDDVKELLREIHTLKGESRMMGFGGIADLAHAVEDVLKAQEARGFRELESVTDELFHAFDCVEKILEEKLGGDAADVDVAGEVATLARLAGAGDGGADEGAASSAPSEAPSPPAEPAGGSFDDFGDLGDLGDLDLPSDDEPSPPPKREPAEAEPKAAAAAGGGASGTAKFLRQYADATRDHLERMNSILLKLEQDPDRPDDVRELLREIHTMKGESRMMGFGDLADLAHAIEDVLKSLSDRAFEGLGDAADLLFDAFDACESLLVGELGGEAPAVDAASLVRRLEEAAAGSPAVSPVAAKPPESEASREAPGEGVGEAPGEAPGEVPGEAAGEAPGEAGSGPLAAEDLPPIDPAIATSFVESVGDHVEQARPALAATDGRRTFRRELEALRADAGMTGFSDLHDLAELVLEVTAPEAWPPAAAEAVGLALDVVEDAARRRVEGRGAGDLLDPVNERLAAAARGDGPEASAPRERSGGSDGSQGPAEAGGSGGSGGAPHGSGPATASRSTQGEAAGATQAPAAPSTPSPAAGPSQSPPGRRATEAGGGGAGAAASSKARADQAARARKADETQAARARKADETQAARARKADETIRISLGRLEDLGNLSGDIYLNHTRGEEKLRRLRRLREEVKRQERAASQLREAMTGANAAGIAANEDLHATYEELLDAMRDVHGDVQGILRAERDDYLRVGHAIVELRERVRELQMLPVSTLFDLYPRMVRDVARQLGKKVRLSVEGGHVELDRRVLDEIRDPMVHLVRNAVDHGIEPPDARERAGKPPGGTIVLSARQEGDRVVIEIRDDGGGIDPEKIRELAVSKGVVTEAEAAALDDEQSMQLIFAPGFSSKEEVSDLSGRGVGMDVVRDKVDRLEGRIGIDSEVGRGTRLSLELPLTLAMARVLLLKAGGLLVAVPSAMVEEVVQVEERAVRRVETYEATEWHGRTIPLVSLANVLEREARPEDDDDRRLIVVLSFQETVVGFVVDALEGEREVVVKPFDDFLGRVRNVAGATILSSGEIVVVLHVPQLISSTMGVSPVRLRARLRAGEVEASEASARRLLVVDDSIIVRDMMRGVLEAAGFEVETAVDGMDGLEKQLAESFELVITDVEMPRMDGFELTRTLKQNEQHQDVPVIIVTTLDSPEAREKGLKAGASAYVVKNLLDMSSLVETIERLAGAP